MKTETAKKANRGHLLRAAKKGQFWVKCCFSLTDDYAFDNAIKFGKMDNFSRVYIVPVFESELEKQINEMYANGQRPTDEQLNDLRRDQFTHAMQHEQAARNAGQVRMRASDFKGKSGHCFGTVEKGSFNIHSNLSYDYEIRK